MNELEEALMRQKRKRRMQLSNNTEKRENRKDYVNGLIVRVLISIIILFTTIILCNFNPKIESFKEEIMSENMSFSKIANVYNKYFGSIVPFESIFKDEQPVFNEKMTYDEITNYKDGFELTVKKDYLVPIINSGVVVFMGEKEGLGNTIIVQGIDEVDYWYSNVTNTSCTLYDYVSKGDVLGNANGEKLYLTFKKGSEYLDYDEVME